jgi:hypothetical protein
MFNGMVGQGEEKLSNNNICWHVNIDDVRLKRESRVYLRICTVRGRGRFV